TWPQPEPDPGAGGPPVTIAHPEGPHPGAVGQHAPYVPREFAKRALSTYVIEPPDILLVQGSKRIGSDIQPIEGQHLVRPDGSIGLGIYGSVFVAGMTIEQVRDSIAALLKATVNKNMTLARIKSELDVDVLAYTH